MNRKLLWIFFSVFLFPSLTGQSWIRINQLGYLPESVKVAVFISAESVALKDFSIHDAVTDKIVLKGKAEKFDGQEWGMKSAEPDEL